MGPFAYILPPETAHIHCAATGLALFRRPNVDTIKEPVAVSEIKQEIRVDVSNDEPLNVNGTVGVDQVAGQVNVQLRDAVKSLSPIPLP